jgi:hypothetical protein
MTREEPLFAIRTNSGYGLFQKYLKTSAHGNYFYIIYCKQIRSICASEIKAAMNSDFYYERIGMTLKWDDIVEELMRNKGVEISLTENFDELVYSEYHKKNIYLYRNDFEDCYITYLGDFPTPDNAQLPKFSRMATGDLYSKYHDWVLCDEKIKDEKEYNYASFTFEELKEVINKKLIEYDAKPKEKMKIYKFITPEIVSYPRYGVTSPKRLLKHFNADYRTEYYNDEYLDKLREERYQEEPYLRPCKEKYEDVKYPLPTENWRKFEDIDDEYIAFCDKVEEAIKAFIAAIDENKKAVSKPLNALLTELNKINSEVYGIDTLEAEELYDYIAKILRALKKPQMIDNIENMREW